MSELYEVHRRPDVDAPVLLVALDGWIDAGLATAAALGQLLVAGEWVPVASFDADDLLDHRSRRPTMHLVDGVVTELSWPSIELRAGTDDLGSDVLLLTGAEPDHRWRAFAAAVVDLALDLGVRQVHGLGAYPAPVPHTRATSVVATATTPEGAAQVGFVPGRIDVPGGVAAAIEARCAAVGVPASGLWAQVPHYAAAMPYPPASVALLEALQRVAGLRFPPGSLAEDATSTRARIDGLVAGNPEHEAMVRQLEEQVDAQPEPAAEETFLMSGEDLAAELEEFLRDEGP